MRLTGLWWWIDRWRKSSAFTSMSLEEQGAYRNLLDEAALRGGPIPDNEDLLARACGDARRWKRVRPAVMARFALLPDGWHNETMDAVLAESQKRSQKQRDYRNRQGNADGNDRGNEPPPPDPDPVVPPKTGEPRPPARGAGSRGLSDRPIAHGECLVHGPICLRPEVVDRLNLLTLFNGDLNALKAWAERVCERWRVRMDAGAKCYTADQFKFWRSEYDTDFGSTKPRPTQPTDGRQVADSSETSAYLRDIKAAR